MSASVLLAALAVSAAPDLQAILDRLRGAQEVPGISAVVTRRHEVLFAGASGVADLESAGAMTPGTVMYAGSLTKVLTAVLTLNLVEERRLALDESIGGIGRDGADGADRVRVVHLLTHVSGLPREGESDYWFTADFPDRTRLVRYLAGAELRSAPGARSRYSNLGYAALGLEIERASGQAFGDALRTRVLRPLGMRASGAPGPGRDVAPGYTPVGRIVPSAERPFAGVGRRVGDRYLREYHDARAMSPAFGAYTSAADLGRLTRFLLGYGGDDVLSPEMRVRMRTNEAFGRGLGLRVDRQDGRSLARHDGWFAAHRSHLLLELDAGIGVAVLGNSDSARPALIAEALLDAALEAGVSTADGVDR